MPWFRIGLVAYIALCALGGVASVIATVQTDAAYIVACFVCGYGLGHGLSMLYSDLAT